MTGLLLLFLALAVAWRYWPGQPAGIEANAPAPAAIAVADGQYADEDGAASPGEPSHQELVAHFEELLDLGHYDEAAAMHEDAQAGAEELYLLLQHAYIERLKRWNKEEDYASVVELTTVFKSYYYNDFYTLAYLAAACSHLGDFRCTVDAYYGAILYGMDQQQSQVARRNLALFLDKTDTLWSKGKRWDELVVLYEHALQWEPDNPAYYLRLAEIYLAMGDLAAAGAVIAGLSPGAANEQRLAAIEQALADEASMETGIALQRKGSHYLVDVLLNGVPARLMIDTGASVSALSRRAAEQLVDVARLQHQGDTELATAGGRIDSPVYLADTVSIDRHDLYGVEWVVIDYPDADVDGVLGMNVLSHFDFRIDQRRQLLMLEPH